MEIREPGLFSEKVKAFALYYLDGNFTSQTVLGVKFPGEMVANFSFQTYKVKEQWKE